MCLLTLLHPSIPPRSKDLYGVGLEHSRLICGIVASLDYVSLPAASIVPLRIAAEILNLTEERKEVIRMFKKIRKKCGCDVQGLVEDLEERWAWSEEMGLCSGGLLRLY